MKFPALKIIFIAHFIPFSNFQHHFILLGVNNFDYTLIIIIYKKELLRIHQKEVQMTAIREQNTLMKNNNHRKCEAKLNGDNGGEEWLLQEQ